MSGVRLHDRVRTSPAKSRWDRRVEAWDEVAAQPAFQRIAQLVHDLARPSSDDVVVDLGTGTGLLALSFAPSVARVVAVDSSVQMLTRLVDKAAERGLRNVQPLVADLRALPIADESATVVVSNYAFHHLEGIGKHLALSEARRVLAPGGRLVVCDMMFGLSFDRRDRSIVASKLAVLVRRGPAGLWRLAKNAGRILVGSWEHPARPEAWREMLLQRRFVDVRVYMLEHEGGIALARRPERSAR